MDRSGPGRVQGRERERERYGKPVAVAAGGLAVVIAVLVSTVLSVSGSGTHEHERGRGGDGTGVGVQDGTGTGPGTGDGTGGGVGPGTSQVRSAAAPEPETCEDGEDPAESLRPSGKAGEAVERIRKRDRLIVGVDQNSYLWGFRDPSTGKIDGFDIDLVRALAEDLLGEDPEITYKTIPTDQRIPAIQKGEVDMVVRTMTVNCERIREVAFSTAYFEAGQQLLVPKENARVKGFDASMRGKRLCFADGSTAQALMEKGKYKALGAKSVVVPNQLDCLVRMQLGKADATLTDSALGAGQAAQDPSVELIGDPETIEPYGIAMNLEDEDLVRWVNKRLDAYRSGGDDSEWRRSYDKWFADDIMSAADGKDPAPPEPKYRD
ncbi:glutamate ABC transporter substrate-binding protein [Streptomyces daliensis]|uniref:Glutamate ABC transporter substrate-binding protein n=1 Tax=Streptomyces daliensis TaxID=299421 RepID=A0A8T4IQ81_9ACTN|nr:glutamate ABC transporter substrate-binding protein [Streptomyces daliensis]